jgi:Protein of unknown function (DUF2924)
MEKLLEELESMNRGELQALWRERFGDAKPYTRGIEMLRRQIACKLQEGRHGGLTTATKRGLRELARLYSEDPKHRATAPPTLQSGTTLTRNWKGTTHTVKVQNDGFLYKGKFYKGLSKIAREITGTRWSGPLFFGLRKTARKVRVAS